MSAKSNGKKYIATEIEKVHVSQTSCTKQAPIPGVGY